MAEDHYSLSAKVFHSIREDILNGKYQANEELKEKTIGDELGVSRTPVREALRQLERRTILLRKNDFFTQAVHSAGCKRTESASISTG